MNRWPCCLWGHFRCVDVVPPGARGGAGGDAGAVAGQQRGTTIARIGFAWGYVEIHIVSTTQGREIAQEIRQVGYGATLLQAEGQSGPVYLINVVVPRKQAADVLRRVNDVDAASFVTVEEARQVVRGYQRLAR